MISVGELRAEALEQWDATPFDEYVDDAGVTHRGRASRFRAEFVEPWATRIGDEERAGGIDRETARQLYDACLSPIPARRALLRRVERTSLRMWELQAQRRLWAEHGVMTRTRRQADSLRDLPWVAHVAGEYGLDVPGDLFDAVAEPVVVDDWGIVNDDEAEAAEIDDELEVVELPDPDEAIS